MHRFYPKAAWFVLHLTARLRAQDTGSRTTSAGSLSSRSPLNEGWRSVPDWVHSLNSTSATSLGSTKIDCLGGWRPSNGLSVCSSGASSDVSVVSVSLREAGAHVAGVLQRAVLVVVADDQRADALAPAALARQPAADHELLRR